MPGTLEETQVRAMFDRIAGVYDRMNTVMTAGLHHQWRRRAADLAGLEPGGRALDVATGTGDLAIELCSRVGPTGQVVAVDFSERMLELARAKSPRLPIRFEVANALALPFSDGEFDAADGRASGPVTSPSSIGVLRRWRVWCAPAGGWSCSR